MTPHRRTWFAASVAAAVFAIGGSLVASAPADTDSKSVPLQPVGAVADFPEWVASVAFSPDGKRLAAGSYESVRIIDAASRKAIASIPCKGFARALAYSPDGKTLVVGGYQTLEVFDAASREKVSELKGHRGYVTGAAFSPDGALLATSSEDETARIWSVADGKEAAVLKGHSYPVQGIAFSPDGKFVATAAGDETRRTRAGEVKLWDAATGQEVRTFPEHERAALSVAFSPDGRHLVSGGADEKANVYEVETGKALGYFGGHARPVNAVQVLAEGDRVVSVGGGGAQEGYLVKVWSLEEGEDLATGEMHKGRVTSLALSPDGKTLATGGHDKAVFFWDFAAFAPKASEQVAQADAQAETETPRAEDAEQPATEIRVGIIGLDTSHAIAFAKQLNVEPTEETKGVRVVCAYPKGSWDIESSVSRIPKYTEEVQAMGIEIVDSIDALLERVDAVLLETNDGRPHFEQALQVFKAGKPVFIDKPLAASLPDAIAIFMAAEQYGTPMFTTSSLRYAEGAQKARAGGFGEVLGVTSYSPCHLEKTHPEIFWYGMHGCEALYTAMGTGCETVVRTSTPDFDHIVGTWKGGRIGTFRGIRSGASGYGGTVFGKDSIGELGPYGGYQALVFDIVKFFRTKQPPVSKEETLELYTFMEAADESKRRGGVPVSMKEVYDVAEKMAKAKLAPAPAAGESRRPSSDSEGERGP